MWDLDAARVKISAVASLGDFYSCRARGAGQVQVDCKARAGCTFLADVLGLTNRPGPADDA